MVKVKNNKALYCTVKHLSQHRWFTVCDTKMKKRVLFSANELFFSATLENFIGQCETVLFSIVVSRTVSDNAIRNLISMKPFRELCYQHGCIDVDMNATLLFKEICITRK